MALNRASNGVTKQAKQGGKKGRDATHRNKAAIVVVVARVPAINRAGTAKRTERLFL